MKIGFIGLGIMGGAMAANLLANGHTLTVHNRTREKAETLIEKGAAWADTPAAAVTDAELVITMLAHPEAVRETALGENGFLDALSPGSLWVDCSTVNPSFSREMAAAAEQRDVRFMDAPVTGSKNQAANAELVFLVGGTEKDLAVCQPLFDVMGRKVLHVGEQGMGSSLKVVVNMLLAISMATFAEGMALGQALGISQETLLSVIVGGPVVAPFIAAKQGKITSGDYSPEFPLQWMHKDLHLATVSAYETGAVSSMAAMAKALYGLAIKAGHGEDDFSVIYEYLTRA